MTTLKQTWSAFTPEIARVYLESYGSPSARSKTLTASVLKELFGSASFRLADFGCGNGHVCSFLREQGLDVEYFGCDFSTSLLAAGRERFAGDGRVQFLEVDIEDVGLVLERCDVVLYSHVIEMLQSPQKSLIAAKRIAPVALIRFFEPPVGQYDMVELRELDTGGAGKQPYLRRTMSTAYYNLVLHEVGCHSVDVHQVEGDKDQVHVVRFGT